MTGKWDKINEAREIARIAKNKRIATMLREKLNEIPPFESKIFKWRAINAGVSYRCRIDEYTIDIRFCFSDGFGEWYCEITCYDKDNTVYTDSNGSLEKIVGICEGFVIAHSHGTVLR